MTNPTPARRIPRADLILLSITLIWGSTFAISKFVMGSVTPMMLQGVRFSLAAVIVGIYTWHDIRATTRRTLFTGLMLGVMLGVGFVLQMIGLNSTSASKTAFLTGTMVVFTPLLQLVIERRLPSIGNVIGVLLVVAGLYWMTSPEGGSINVGDILVLLSAVAFAFYIVYLDVFTKERFHQEIVFHQFVATAVIAFMVLPFEGSVSHWNGGALAGMVYLAVFASVIAIFVQAKYQRETTPTRAAVIFSIEPVIAAIIAWLMLGEKLTGPALWGAVVIFAGLLISELWSFVFPHHGD